MILKIVHKDPGDCNSIQRIAKELLGNTVYVNWPHLEEMKLVQFSILKKCIEINLSVKLFPGLHLYQTHLLNYRLMKKNN